MELNRRMSREQYQVRLTVEDELAAAIAPEAGRSLVRIVQEALNNVRRHSGARNVRVTLRMEGDDLCMEVADDGRGFEAQSSQGGVGTNVMQQRALNLGGELEIESKPGVGTVVRFRCPAERMLGDYPR